MFQWLLRYALTWLFKPLLLEDPKPKKQRIPKSLRDSVWEHYHHDRNIGRCYSCNISVTRYNAGWNCSHVKSDAKGGPTTLSNLRVCCPGCNLSMGDQNMYAFIRDKKMKGQGSQNYDAYFRKFPKERNDKRSGGNKK